MMTFPKNKDAIRAGLYDINERPSNRTKAEFTSQDDIIAKAIAANKILKASEPAKMDVSAYRGNLFKQTLGNEWDTDFKVPAQKYLDIKRHERKRGSVGSLQ